MQLRDVYYSPKAVEDFNSNGWLGHDGQPYAQPQCVVCDSESGKVYEFTVLLESGKKAPESAVKLGTIDMGKAVYFATRTGPYSQDAILSNMAYMGLDAAAEGRVKKAYTKHYEKPFAPSGMSGKGNAQEYKR